MNAHRIRELEQRVSPYASSLLPLSVPCDVGVREVMAAVMGQPLFFL
jgi:hypothetical protein